MTSDNDTIHQKQYFVERNRMRLAGRFRGQPYSVLFDFNEGTVVAEDDEKYVEVGKAKQTERETKQGNSPCPGCGKGLNRLIKGGWGWAKAALLRNVSAEVIAERKSICEACPSNCYDFGVCRDDFEDRPDEEQGCGCVLSLKVLIPDEECPHKHWGKVKKRG